ncbi:MAG TPA: peptide chain release factor N(5)-glutamine methyltransferase [Bryobacteraceae bacterium]|nr:peptide chain release factor N(5)-glutamine methyltransferase [Bryobacteraceae bacterium]
MDIRTALLQGQKLFEDEGVAAPRLTAEVLLAHAIGCERVWLFAHSDEELRELWWIHYGRYLHQRLKGVPTQYITGRQEFYGRDFRVTPDVLIPRPETEHTVEAALERRGEWKDAVDIGTGSGAIAVTLALETGAHVCATDISPAALQIAASNASRLGAGVRFIACDLGSALRSASFDLVISNPPYVPARDTANVQREVRDHEPPLALYGGHDGLEIYRRLIPDAARLLRPGGWLIMELGYAATEEVGEMLEGWAEVEIHSDLAGLPRVATARVLK